MDTLYHYSSTEAFHSIISSRSIRLSSLSLSNDSMEGKLVSKLMREIAVADGLDKDSVDGLLSAVSFLEECLDGLGFCLSQEGDLLSQWRGYADDATGVSIGFSKEYLDHLSLTTFRNKTGHFLISQVKYDKKEHLQLLGATYREIKELIATGEAYKPCTLRDLIALTPNEKIEAENKRNKELRLEVHKKVASLNQDMFLLKTSAFQEEQEWRLLSVLVSGNNNNISFRPEPDRIIPYCEIELENLKQKAINKVILGPKNITSIHVIESFLIQSGFEGVEVKNSSATYRG